MKFASVRELKNKTSALLRRVYQGENVIITHRGKPKAVIRHLTEDEIEDYIIANSKKLKKELREAFKEHLKGKGRDIDEIIREIEEKFGERI